MCSILIKQIKAARRVSVPLIGIVTPDPGETIRVIVEALKRPIPTSEEGKLPAMLVWDIVEGLQPRNDEGKAAKAIACGETDNTIGNPVELLKVARRLPEWAVLFIHLANRWLPDPMTVQAAWNLRDAFKSDHRTAIFLGPDLSLPSELAGDVLVLDEPLPDAEQLAGIVQEQHNAASIKADKDTVSLAVEAVQGLCAFAAEQTVAMSLTKQGLDLSSLWERKRRQIELTPGLKVHREPVRFEDIGGVSVIKGFLARILAGEARPNAIVFVDEIEKFLAGSSGASADTSGVSQDQLGALLSYMQDHQAAGCILIGPPGAAKSMIAKATGNEAGIPTIQLDLGGMKGSLVGQSEQAIRAALKVVTSVSNGRSLWLATCNSISDLPPELRRRFTLGTFFFDLPDAEERKAIWKIYLSKYNLKRAGLPEDEGWTGAEIRQCCDLAWRLGCTLLEASQFVVPVSQSAADQLEKLRRGAEGRFLSASHPGVYERKSSVSTLPASPKRKLSLED